MTTGRTRVLRGSAWRRSQLRRRISIAPRLSAPVAVDRRMALAAPTLTPTPPSPDRFAGLRLRDMPTPRPARWRRRRPWFWGVPAALLAAVAMGTGGAVIWGGYLAPDPVPVAPTSERPADPLRSGEAAHPSSGPDRAMVTPTVERILVRPDPPAAGEPVATPAHRGSSRPRTVRRSRPEVDPPAAVATGPGYLNVAAEPYATVYLDGRRLGDTPLLDVELGPGTYQLRGVAADGRTASAVVTVRAGATVRHRLSYGK